LNKNINEGLDKNLSLKNLILQKSIKKSQAESFLAQNKPNIYISNSLSSTFSKGDSLATNIDSEKSGSNYTNTISLNFAWSIFDGGQNKNSYKSKIADSESEKYAYENLKNFNPLLENDNDLRFTFLDLSNLHKNQINYNNSAKIIYSSISLKKPFY